MLLDRSFKTKLNAYIVKNYTELCRDDDQYLMWDAGESLAKDAGLTNNESLDLKSLIDEVGDTFHDKLFQYIDNSGMTDVEIYKKAGLDRKLFSKSAAIRHIIREKISCWHWLLPWNWI